MYCYVHPISLAVYITAYANRLEVGLDKPSEWIRQMRKFYVWLQKKRTGSRTEKFWSNLNQFQ